MTTQTDTNGRTVSYTAALTVSAGTATDTSITYVGSVLRVGVIPVSEVAAYTCTIYDSDGFALHVIPSATGTTTAVRGFRANGVLTIKITGASVDGAYSVRLFII